jgi:hypothetical protein
MLGLADLWQIIPPLDSGIVIERQLVAAVRSASIRHLY